MSITVNELQTPGELTAFVQTRSEPAFDALVKRYLNLVYASALRHVRDHELAQDVTQAVFTILAQKASAISPDRPLSAWLLTTTRFVSLNERRLRAHQRQLQERVAAMSPPQITMPSDDAPDWEALGPVLDEGLARLKSADRDALMLRFFERQSIRQVGEKLGISEEAAGKRITRALERLRTFFRRRGVTASDAAPAVALIVAGKSAPEAFRHAIAAAALKPAAATSSAILAKGAIALMAAQKIKAVIALAAVLALGIGGGGYALVTVLRPARPAAVVKEAVPTLDPAQPTLTFSDGTTIQFLAIHDLDQTPTWWGADGSFVPPPPQVTNREPFAALSPGLRKICIHVEGPDWKRGDDTLSFFIRPGNRPGNGASHSTMWVPAPGRGLQGRCVIGVAEDAQTLPVTIGHASGPWETVAEAVLPASPATQPTTDASRCTISLRDLDFKPVDPTHDRRPDGQQRYVALANGRTVTPQRMSNMMGDITLEFPVPRAEITKVLNQSRPIEWRELVDVPVPPKAKSATQPSPAQ